jgi:hypothetical protein
MKESLTRPSVACVRWLLWISLCILLSESLMSLLVLVGRVAVQRIFFRAQQGDAEDIDPALPHQQVPQSWWIAGAKN